MSSSSGGFWPGEQPGETPEDDEPKGQDAEVDEADEVVAEDSVPTEPEAESEAEAEPEPTAEPEAEDEPEVEAEDGDEDEDDDSNGWQLPESSSEPAPFLAHRPGEIDVPGGIAVIEGRPSGSGRSVGIVVARFNSEITNALLETALEALAAAGVEQDRITVMPVPGAFELPIGAMALAKTRRYSCVIGLGCVIRGETSHFDFVATETASGLQLAGLETGVPVAFGVLTVDTVQQAEERISRGGDAARAALEMADIFSQVRAEVRAAG